MRTRRRTFGVSMQLKTRNGRQVLLLAAVTLAESLIVGVTCSADKQPNILILLADDMGYSGVGPYGSEIATPDISGTWKLDNIEKVK